MNKLKDLFLLVITFSIAILLSVNLQLTDGSSVVENPAQPNQPTVDVSIAVPTDASPIPMEKDGWHWSVYRDSMGVLCYKDSCLIANDINDFYVTPWGKCFWQGDAGWQFAAVSGPAGKELTIPNELTSTKAIYGIDISRTFENGAWKYYVEHLVPPRDRYHHEGHVYYDGKEVPDGNKPNDYLVTPFGYLYWHGTSKVTRYGPQGWMRIPNPRHPIGDEVSPVTIDSYDFT